MESNWSMFRFKFLLLVGINSLEDYTCQWKIAIGKWFKETLLLGNYWEECLSNFFYRYITWVVTWVQLRRIIFRCSLTLKWPRYFYSRWCPRGVPWTPWENHFSTGILQWNLHHICTGNKKSQFCKKKIKMLYRFKMAAKEPIFISRHFDFGQLLKTHFPKGIFQWNSAQRRRIWIDLHYWNNNFQKLFHFKMVAKTMFWYCAIMLIYAN